MPRFSDAHRTRLHYRRALLGFLWPNRHRISNFVRNIFFRMFTFTAELSSRIGSQRQRNQKMDIGEFAVGERFTRLRIAGPSHNGMIGRCVGSVL